MIGLKQVFSHGQDQDLNRNVLGFKLLQLAGRNENSHPYLCKIALKALCSNNTHVLHWNYNATVSSPTLYIFIVLTTLKLGQQLAKIDNRFFICFIHQIGTQCWNSLKVLKLPENRVSEDVRFSTNNDHQREENTLSLRESERDGQARTFAPNQHMIQFAKTFPSTNKCSHRRVVFEVVHKRQNLDMTNFYSIS